MRTLRWLLLVLALAAGVVAPAAAEAARPRAVVTYLSTGFRNPSSLPGLRLWLKADALGLNDGDAVGTWADSSGRGNTASQGTAANKPTYKAAIAAGMPTVRFDGVNDYLNIATDPGWSGSTGDTLFAVVKATDPSAGNYIWISGTNTVHAEQFNANLSYSYVGGATITGRYGYTATTPQILTTWYDGSKSGSSANALKKRLNGADQTLTFANTVPSTRGTGVGTDLGRYTVGANAYLAGDVYEIVFYNRPLSVSEQAKVERYLSRKYGVAVSS